MRRTTALLTAFFLALPAAAGDDPNPEPPKPGPLEVRLVAKKKTYKLDLGGLTAAKFRAKIKAGGANLPGAPTVDLVMRITNYTRNDVRIRVASSASRMSVSVTGKNVVEASVNGIRTRPKPSYVVLNPRQSTDIPISQLITAQALTRHTRHYWTEPGEYTLAASFYTLVYLDYQKGGRPQYMTLKTRAIKVKVEK